MSAFQLIHKPEDQFFPTKEQILTLEQSEFMILLVHDALSEQNIRNRFISYKKSHKRCFSSYAGSKAITNYDTGNKYNTHLFPRYLLVTRIS